MVIVPMFDEYSTIWRTLIRCVPRECASRMVRSATFSVGGSRNEEPRVHDSFLEPGCDGDELEGRARLVGVGDGAIAAPVRTRGREPVRVEPRRGGHREDRARLGIHDDGSRGLRRPAPYRLGKNLLGVGLDLTVDREPHVLARGLLLRLDDVESAAERILDDRLTARLARECPLERPLQPFETLVVEAGKAEDLGRDRSLRVEAELLRIEPETGVAELLELLGLARIRLPLDVHEASRAVGQRRIENRRIGPEDLCRRTA